MKKSNWDRAKKALYESGFISAYHRILDVMEGNKDSVYIVHETSTRRWGCQVLKEKEKMAINKNPKCASDIALVTVPYYEYISTRHWEIMDQIIKNKCGVKKKKKEEEKKRPVIAVDVDSVLRNNLGLMVDLYNENFGKNLTISQIEEFKAEKSFPAIEEQTGSTASNWFFVDHAKELFLDAPAYDGVKEDMDRLKEVADIVIITYQKNYTNKDYTLKWLEKNGIEPNGICFLRDKTLLHCDILVDDNDWNFNGTHVKNSVLVTMPYNKNLDLNELKSRTNSNYITRVDSFHDFVEKYLNNEIKMEG